MGAVTDPALVRRIVAYVAVGAVGTVLYLAVYNGLRLLIEPLAANAVATALALVFSFWGNRRLAFGVAGQQGLARDFTLFSVVFLGTLAISSGALVALFALMDDPGRIAENLALLTATAITFVLRYVLLSRLVFNPSQERSGTAAPVLSSGRASLDGPRVLRLALWSLLALWVAVLVIAAWDARAFSPDSWAYWDMAQRLQEGRPYTMHGVRQFQTEPGVAISFPLLYPALLAVTDVATGVGLRAGLVVNALSVLLAAGIVERRWGRGMPGLGPLVLLALATWYPFANELAAARSMPVAVLLLCALAVMATDAQTPRRWLACGLLGGALYLTRFDALAAVAAFPVLLVVARALVARRWPDGAALRPLGTYLAGVLALVVPALLLGLVSVGQLPTSDNARTASAAETVYVTHYHPDGVPTLVDAPGQWASKLLGNVAPLASTTWDALPSLLVFLAVAIVLAGSLWRLGGQDRAHHEDRAVLGALLAAFALSLAVGVLTTGYVNLRYWGPVLLVSMLLVVHTQLVGAPAASLRRSGAGARIGAALGAVALLVALQLPTDRGTPGGQLQEHASFSTVAIDRTTAESQPPMPDLSCTDPGARVLALVHARASAREAALGERMVVSRPGNLGALDAERLARFLREHPVDHLVAPDPGDLELLRGVADLDATACPHVYRVS